MARERGSQEAEVAHGDGDGVRAYGGDGDDVVGEYVPVGSLEALVACGMGSSGVGSVVDRGLVERDSEGLSQGVESAKAQMQRMEIL